MVPFTPGRYCIVFNKLFGCTLISDEWGLPVSETLCRRLDFPEAVIQTHSMEMRSSLRRPSSQESS
jgi:hypothetical protein